MLSLTSIKTILLTLAVMTATTSPEKGFAQQAKPNGGWVTRNGNVFELSQERLDTVVVVNPVTEQKEVRTRRVDSYPIKLNGKNIIERERVDKWPYFTPSDKNLSTYLVRNLNSELSQLPDGKYTLSIWNMITDERGKIVYYDFYGVQNYWKLKPDNDTTVKQGDIGNQLQDNIRKKVDEVIDKALIYRPASLNGQNVPAHTHEIATDEWFTVKGHEVQIN